MSDSIDFFLTDGESRRFTLVKDLLFLELGRSSHGGVVITFEKYAGKTLFYYTYRLGGEALWLVVHENGTSMVKKLFDVDLVVDTPEFVLDDETLAYVTNTLIDYNGGK